MLLTDVFIIENLNILEESKAKGTMKISGVFQRAEEANNNNRIYPKPVLEGQISKIQPMIEDRRLCGELDHPTNDTVKLSNASHLITQLKMEGNDVTGEAEILNTPAGLTAQALIKGGVKIGISSRGMGTLSEGDENTKRVNEDFNLVTFDLVADPSTRGAYPGLMESTQRQMCEGAACVKKSLTERTKEKIFVTLLKNKLTEGSAGVKRLERKRDAIDKAAGPGPNLPPEARELSVRIGRKKAQGERRKAARQDSSRNPVYSIMTRLIAEKLTRRQKIGAAALAGGALVAGLSGGKKKHSAPRGGAGVVSVERGTTGEKTKRDVAHNKAGKQVGRSSVDYPVNSSRNPVYSKMAKIISDSTLHPTDIGGFDKERQRAVTPATPEEMKREQERRKKAGLNPDGTKKKPVKKQTNREVARATRYEDEGAAVK